MQARVMRIGGAPDADFVRLARELRAAYASSFTGASRPTIAICAGA